MLSNRIGRWTLIALAGLVFTVGCRSTKTDRIRYLEAENAKLSAENSSLSDDLAAEQAATYREAEAKEKAQAESHQKDATIAALAQRKGGIGEIDSPGVETSGDTIIISSDITFQPGQATLTARAEKALAEVARRVNEEQFASLRIVGHTDSDPIRRSGWKSNEELSLARAESVRKMLARKGIQLTLMETQGLGASVPRESNKTAAGKAKNRRVEIILVRP
ncbi:MAG: OmpA/MotB family protein [Planctomycetota bacterium]